MWIFQIERDQKKKMTTLEGKKKESASRLGMGLGGFRYDFLKYVSCKFSKISYFLQQILMELIDMKIMLDS